MKHKILVGTVTNQVKDYCWDKFSKQLKGLQMQGHDVLIIDNSPRLQPRKGFKTIHYKKFNEIIGQCQIINANLPRDKWVNGLMQITKECMNILRDEFLKGDYTHLFILESDVFIEKDTVERLLDMDADVANFTYLMKLQRFDEYSLCVQTTKDRRARMITPEAGRKLINQGIVELGKTMLDDRLITHCGYGCTLVRRKVLEAIEFKTKFHDKDIEAYPDSSFHADVLVSDFTNKLNTDWLPIHENLHNQTMDMMKILMVQNKMSRKERRKQR
jgi:hypothetical protein